MIPNLVSIVIPTYNRKDIIDETINSALGQTYQNIEVIILDNNSDDGSYNYLKKKYQTNRNVAVYSNESTLDIVKNWRKCFEYANGEYVHILWSDDLISPEFILRTLDFLESNPEAGFVYTKTAIFDNDSGISKTVFNLDQSGLIEKSVFIEKSLLGMPLSVPVSPANALFRRNDVDKNLLIDIPNNFGVEFSKLGQGNDCLLFLLSLNHYSHFGYLDEELAFFRAHSNSITLSTDSFLVTFRYHLAKAYFVSLAQLDMKLIKRFNSKSLVLTLLGVCLGKGKMLSIPKLYTSNVNTTVDYPYVLVVLANYLRHGIIKLKLTLF
jgi:glycosyltransferase involved in cell wall biosynthesis